MPFLAPLLPVAGSALVGLGISKGADALFGGGKSGAGSTAEDNLLRGPIRNVTAPGFTSTLSGGALNFGRGEGTTAALGGLRDITAGTVGELQNLEGEVSPGFGRLTSATKDIFGNLRSDLSRRSAEAKGSLKTNLARRGVLGSSFGEDAINRKQEVFDRAERDLAAQEEQLTSQNILRELDVRNQLINQRFNILQQRADTEIKQLNFESQIANSLAIGATSALSAGARAIAELEAERASNTGAFFQPLIEATGKAVSTGIEGLFN